VSLQPLGIVGLLADPAGVDSQSSRRTEYVSFWDVEVYACVACVEGIVGVIRDVDGMFKSRVETWQSDRNPTFLDSLIIESN
jgi:hypothetical protein